MQSGFYVHVDPKTRSILGIGEIVGPVGSDSIAVRYYDAELEANVTQVFAAEITRQFVIFDAPEARAKWMAAKVKRPEPAPGGGKKQPAKPAARAAKSRSKARPKGK